VGDLRRVSGSREGLEPGLDQRGDAAAQDRLLAEQIGLRLLAERRLEHARAGAADPGGIGEGIGQHIAARILVHRDERRHAPARPSWSGTSIMMTSAARAASATGRTSRSSARARSHDAPPGRKPTITRAPTPESRRLSACAWPWLPYPITATTRFCSRAGSAS